jgi:5-formaminoimidazole-4-carboxamide-1-(beta)-D-ribofuranosyl 5'-monophosphate synthetase
MDAYTISTLGSHSALQILKGAKDEGFTTMVICIKGRETPYQSFGVADKIVTLDTYKDLFELDKELATQNVILVPHASLISYLDLQSIKNLKTKYFGNKDILVWESDRDLEGRWLREAGLKLPKIYPDPEAIDRPVIVKFHGAGGGKGYFLAKSANDFQAKIKAQENQKKYLIQEYIMGVPIYAHFFYSLLENRLELMGFDKRYETNVDAIGRISAQDQMDLPLVDPSYVVIGNFPVVIRESLLPEILGMGESVVEVSRRIAPPAGLFGPFCLEMVITPAGEIYTFEISARIVAGTNPYIGGSPYTFLLYDEPMSTGRRIAREIKNAIKLDRLNTILT